MILYHGTTEKRALQILAEKEISCTAERFFTQEENGDGYSTPGFVYLTNEITYAAYMANCHTFVDKSKRLYIFRIDMPTELIETDYDEMRYQDSNGSCRSCYSSDMECSLNEFKTCRIPFSIVQGEFAVEYTVIDKAAFPDIAALFNNTGASLEYVQTHYSSIQKDFIKSLVWKVAY